MRLIYGAEAFEGIVHDLLGHDITENGIIIKFQPTRKEGIILGDDDQRTVFLNSSLNHGLTQVKHFVIDKKRPAMICISANPLLKKGELMNQILLNQIIPLKNVIFLGSHEYSKPELDFLNNNKLHFFPMHEIASEGYHEVCESVMSISKRFTDLYILIDSSILDQSILHAGRPGGLMPRELVFILQRLKHLKPLDTFELVISPAARDLAVKILSQIYVDKK